MERQDHKTSTDASKMSLRHSMRFVLVAWGFGAAWMYIMNGAAATEYARLLGVSPFGFGLLASAMFIGAFAQLPMSWLIERFGHRKAFFMTVGIIHRSIWFGLAAIPWVLPDRMWAITLVIGTMIAMLLGSAAGLAWMNWVADLVPGRIRGRYFSRRFQLGQFVGLVTTLTVGFGLDRARGLDPDSVRAAISLAYVVAAVVGVIDLLLHAPVPSPPHEPSHKLGLWGLMKQPLADKNFRRFLGFSATMTFAIAYVGQFINLYLLENVVVDVPQKYLLVNVMTQAIPLLVMIPAYPIWGRLMDRFGRRPVMVIAGLMIVNGGSSWVFVTPDNWQWGYAMVLVAAFAWPAVDLGNFNLLVSMSESHGGARAGSAYVAINSLVVAAAGALSGLFAGSVAELLGRDWRMEVLGWPVTYHGVLLLLSALFRLAALGWLIHLHEPRAVPTREAAAYMVSSLYANVQEALLLPARIVGQLSRISFLVRPRNRDDQ